MDNIQQMNWRLWNQDDKRAGKNNKWGEQRIKTIEFTESIVETYGLTFLE